MRTSGIAASLGILLTSIPCFPQATVDFIREVQPILVSRCHSCHGSKLHLGELRLDRKSDALRGGGSGVPAIVPHKSAESLLYDTSQVSTRRPLCRRQVRALRRSRLKL